MKSSHVFLSAILTLAALAFSSLVHAAEAEDVGAKLTPKLKELIQQEMLAVSEARQEITTAVTAGDLATVAAKARNIRDSFIMKKSLTPQDKKDLMSAVPPRFVEMDGNFHGTAGKLAEAADNGDRDLVHYYFDQMNRACAGCHAKFATGRFPGFGGEKAAAGHHHH